MEHTNIAKSEEQGRNMSLIEVEMDKLNDAITVHQKIIEGLKTKLSDVLRTSHPTQDECGDKTPEPDKISPLGS